MGSSKITWLFAGIGGAIGGYIPLLWGSSYFSFPSLLFNTLGAFAGVWTAVNMILYG